MFTSYSMLLFQSVSKYFGVHVRVIMTIILNLRSACVSCSNTLENVLSRNVFTDMILLLYIDHAYSHVWEISIAMKCILEI